MTAVVVTGASSGIGFATALRLAAAGFEVIAGMRDPSAGAETLLEAAGSNASSIKVIELDVDSDDSVDAAFRQLPPIGALVNNAGVTPAGPIEEFTIAEWKAAFETNVFGVVRCTQAVLPEMRGRGSGCIVNVGSFGAQFPVSPIAAYVSSKASLASLSEVLAVETKRFGVRVVLLDVGYTATSVTSKVKPLSRSSPYADVARNGMLILTEGFTNATDPAVIADAIHAAITDSSHPFRTAVGNRAAESIALRRTISDEAWIEMLSSDRATFVDHYRSSTGIDITPRSTPRP